MYYDTIRTCFSNLFQNVTFSTLFVTKQQQNQNLVISKKYTQVL